VACPVAGVRVGAAATGRGAGADEGEAGVRPEADHVLVPERPAGWPGAEVLGAVGVLDRGLAEALPVADPLAGLGVCSGWANTVHDDHEAGRGELVVDPAEFVADAFDVGPIP
jgi:hypothetical protein